MGHRLEQLLLTRERRLLTPVCVDHNVVCRLLSSTGHTTRTCPPRRLAPPPPLPRPRPQQQRPGRPLQPMRPGLPPRPRRARAQCASSGRTPARARAGTRAPGPTTGRRRGSSASAHVGSPAVYPQRAFHRLRDPPLSLVRVLCISRNERLLCARRWVEQKMAARRAAGSAGGNPHAEASGAQPARCALLHRTRSCRVSRPPRAAAAARFHTCRTAKTSLCAPRSSATGCSPPSAATGSARAPASLTSRAAEAASASSCTQRGESRRPPSTPGRSGSPSFSTSTSIRGGSTPLSRGCWPSMRRCCSKRRRGADSQGAPRWLACTRTRRVGSRRK